MLFHETFTFEVCEKIMECEKKSHQYFKISKFGKIQEKPVRNSRICFVKT